MSPERWKQVEEVFQAALDLPEAERAEYISTACAGDEELCQQVTALVDQYEESGDFIEQPAQVVVDIRTGAGLFTTGAMDEMGEPTPDPMIGRRIGPYKLIQEIGRGGMGAVYLAERADGEFRQRVAVKLIKRGMDTDFILRRFRNERQILATLDHPNIGRLLDGGTTEDGLPYFVMEYIEGLPLYRYCDERRLNVRQRLRLFCQLCDAVSYAHRGHVIHRDIKPSNVLVTASGTPKLLDFGIAKLLNPELVGDITHDPTATAMRLMTPEYASPEQALGQPVTTATDIYSLGVLLYELLTGHKPYHLHARASHEIARVICEEEPERPSEVITDTDDLLFPHPPGGESQALSFVYENRGATAESLRRDLAGDLDNVVMKALRKEPGDRYESAQALRDDLMRHIEGKPVLAPSYFPSPGRIVPEARQAVEKSLAVLPLRVIGRSSDEETDGYLGVGLADALITRLGSLRRFALRPTSSVLRFNDENTDPLAAGRELGVSFVLEGRIHRDRERIRVTLQLLDVRKGSAVWAGQFDQKFTDVLALEDAVSSQVAEALVPELTGGERQRLAKGGTDSVEAHEAYLRGRYHWNSFTEEGLARALTHFHDAVAIDPNYALPHAGIADYFNWLGVYCVMPFAETSAAAKEAALRAVQLDPALPEGYAALGFATLTHDFDWGTAEAHCRRAVALNPNYTTAHVWYAYQLMMEGRFDEAAREARSALRLDPLSAMTLHTATWCNYQSRRYDDAVAAARRLVALEPTHGIGHLFLGHTLAQAGEYDEAITEGLEAAEVFSRSPYSLSWLAMTYAEAGRPEEARSLLREIEETSAGRYVSPYLLAMVHCGLGDSEAALALLEEAHTIRDAWLTWLGVEPRLDPLRDDPRFRDLMRRTNNPLAARRDAAAPQQQQAAPRSVAVLPLKVIGAPRDEETDGYLGVGLADALITRLSNVQRFAVRPTGSVMRFGGEGVDPFAAGRELGAEYVVSGHVQRAGERVRVSVQLLNVSAGTTVWADSFDEEFTDVLRIQDEVSTRVAEALVPRLSGDERQRLAKRGTNSVEAFEAYLRGRYHLSLVTPDNLARSLAQFERAVSLDARYALAHAGMAECYFCMTAFAGAPPREYGELARAAGERAIRLDDQLGEAYAILGFISLFHDLDRAEAERLLRRSLRLSPNYALGHVFNSVLQVGRGDADAAVSSSRRAAELDPASAFNRQHLAWILYHARRFDEAQTQAARTFATDPDFGHGRTTYGWILRQAGRFDEAAEHGRRAVELMGGAPWPVASLAATYAADGKQGEARALLEQLARDASAGRHVSPFNLAVAHLHLGERECALSLLEESLEVRDVWSVWMPTEPQLDALRGEARFEELLRRIGGAAVPSGRTIRPRATPAPPPAPAANAAAAPAPRRTQDDEAHQLYVAGRYYATRRTAEGLRQAIERLERAVERDPSFALAYAEMADCYALLNWYVEPPPDDAWECAKRAAQNAVEADPELAEAHASLGFVICHYDRDFASAERELRRAVELNSANPVARRWHAFNLSAMGRHTEAISEIKKARELNPRSPVMATAVANVLFLARRFDEAIEQCHRALELDPGSVAAHVVLRWAYERKGLHDEALSVFEQERVFAGETPTTRAKRAHVFAAAGRTEEARELLRELIEKRDTEWVTAYEIAVVLALLGERDEGLEWLERAGREHTVGFTFARVDPHLDPLRPDPRFEEILVRHGHAPSAPHHPSPSTRPVTAAGEEVSGDAVTLPEAAL
ncbi:MAG TPA: protein kinase [Pyrinomonadaceae bacterium]|nr:protein kinase [Pyrinomonadaceae bacterium]